MILGHDLASIASMNDLSFRYYLYCSLHFLGEVIDDGFGPQKI